MNTESVNSHTGSTSPGSPDDTGPHPAVRLWSRLRAVLVTLALTFVVLIVLEGLSGAVLFTLDTLRADREAAAQRISRHDPELGWVLLPDLQFPALWSPEAGLWTNEQSFRSRHAVPPDERVGTVRVICSGDSFTFGEGVANEDTWCSKLAGIDSRLDPVNLGQGGYGVGQAYLWFMRSTGNIEHSVQLFAFISIDFNRMHRASFRLWAKPKLVVRDGELVIANAPIGRNFRLIGWVERRRNLAERFNVWRLVKRVQASFESDEAAPGDELDQGVETRVEGVEAPDSASVEVATAIFAALAERNRAKGSTLVLVHLPSMADLQAGDGTALYRSWDRAITELAAQHDYVYIDLVRELTKLPADDRRRLFNTHDLEGYRPAGGHYSAYGNAVVARALYDQLTQVPAIRDRLAALPHADMQ